MLAVFTLHSSLRSLGQSRDIFLFEDDIAGLLCLVDTKKQHFTNDLIPLAQNIWLNPVLRDFKSISEAREILLGTQRNWSMFPGREYGRSKLIQKQLPFVSNKPISFPEKPKNSPLGSWTLLDKNKILFSSACSSRVSHGIYNFIEDKNGPPSRAYLKLWEFFTKEGVIPKSDSSCIDLGASPGGWSWVLSGLSKRVHAVDKSPIEKSLGLNRKIRFHQADVLKIKRLDDIDRSINWLF
ncbi:MAG TPA: SAM-dependent methyltransferase [Oligoflexia bacterium]|nr:SAM-dependent methyltransferase [Oligoflexia bacterium]